MRITRSVFRLYDFLSWQRSGELDTSPKFQRRSVWSASAKSFLVDTVIRDMPVPIIILRNVLNDTTYHETREVVDGQQRLRTLLGFVDSSVLPDFDEAREAFTVRRTHNADLAGLSFAQFPPELKTKVLNYEFSVHTLPSDTTDKEVLQIFARLNSSGVKLNEQEIRNAEFTGVLKTLVYDVALDHLERWRRWKVFSEVEIARMDEVEATSDIVLMMQQGLKAKTQGQLTRFYAQHEEEFDGASEVPKRFDSVMEAIDSTIGGWIAGSQLARKTVFPLVFAVYYDLMFGLGTPLETVTPRPLGAGLSDALRAAALAMKDRSNLPEAVSDALRGSTNNVESRRAVFDFLKGGYDRTGA
ncbi:DUF262 domain-containing protein [Deinococcus aestuarii]|uniref:DUF262 domain-containing protein n=1 Tax=Deinococcus aestuarii TaxID=2774531 RepID=UPI001C0E7929|nr:DUF262 domain-containing protein [Deinococcus aestuarii]